MPNTPVPPPLAEFGAFRTPNLEDGPCGQDQPCVEVATHPGGEWYLLRDTKDERPDRPVLAFNRGELDRFVRAYNDGEFNQP